MVIGTSVLPSVWPDRGHNPELETLVIAQSYVSVLHGLIKSQMR